MSQPEVEISPTVQYVRVEGDFVLMDLTGGLYFGLDAVGSHIWQSLSAHGNVSLAAEELSREYAITPEQALADIREWVAELESKGLVSWRRTEGRAD